MQAVENMIALYGDSSDPALSSRSCRQRTTFGTSSPNHDVAEVDARTGSPGAAHNAGYERLEGLADTRFMISPTTGDLASA